MNASAQTDYLVFDEHGFYIEYPSSWEITDTWQHNATVYFQSDYMGKTGVSVSYADLVLEPSLLDQDWVAAFGNNLEEECRLNTNGPCWFFDLLDSKITTIGGQAAASVKYSQTLNDENMVVRTILLPDRQKTWQIEWRAMEDSVHLEDHLEKTAESFLPPGYETRTSSIGTSLSSYGLFEEDTVVLRHYDVNLILIGEHWSSLLKSQIRETLPDYRDVMYVKSLEETGVRHTYGYNFISFGDEDIPKLVKFMERNSEPMPIFGSDIPEFAYWQAGWVERNHPELADLDYRIVDAVAAEEYLYEQFIGSDPKLNTPNSVNLVFLALDLDDAGYLRNYYVDSVDGATGKAFTAHGLMGYGGNHRMMFFDLYAVPWFDLDLRSGKFYYTPWIESLHDCDSSRCLADLVLFHAGESLRYVVSPHLLYRVTDADRYIIETLVYIKPGGEATITESVLNRVVDMEKIKNEFSFLYPHSKWDVNMSVERRDTRGISYDFKKILETTTHHTLSDLFGNQKNIQLLQTDSIRPYLVEWGVAQSSADEQTQVIPVLIEIDSSRNIDVYLDDVGILGIAPSNPDSDEPCCAFGVTSQKKLWTEKISFTDLLIHEAGHALGLMHPFMSVDEYGDLTVNKYFNWYTSPMTYSFPNSGCGLIFYLRHSEPCGNASLSFTEFERNVVSDARLADLWKETEANVQNGKTSALLADSKTAYYNGDAYSPRGALVLAKEAYGLSSTVEEEPPVKTETVIPLWVRTNVGWWAEGAVDDGSFLRGIQYMINEEIITIPNLPESSESSDGQVPSWVRANAKWWVEGAIGQDDFINGIKYMVETGLIQIN